MALKVAGSIAEFGGIVRVQATEALRSYKRRKMRFRRRSHSLTFVLICRSKRRTHWSFHPLYPSPVIYAFFYSSHGGVLPTAL